MTPTSTESTPVVAVDDGYARMKVVADGVRLSHPTVVVAGNSMSALDGGVSAGWYETQGRRYTAGASVGEGTRSNEFHVSDLNRVAVHHALREGGYGGRDVRLVVGLPVGDFFRQGGRNDRLIAEKVANLSVPVSAFVGETARVAAVRVCAQGVGAWFDHAIGDDLETRAGVDVAAPVAVVDIGGRTTDVAVVLGGASIDHARSGSENVGALDVVERLAGLIRDKYRIEERLPAKFYDQALRTGVLPMFGRGVDVSGLVAEAVAAVDGTLERFVARLVGSGADLSAVLLVGGGAALFRGLADRYPHGAVVGDAEFANARGFHKWGQLKDWD